ncbi:MAG: FliA/WhiG family RNA polymerase sigma factor [Acidobacteriaceae bacterium]
MRNANSIQGHGPAEVASLALFGSEAAADTPSLPGFRPRGGPMPTDARTPTDDLTRSGNPGLGEAAASMPGIRSQQEIKSQQEIRSQQEIQEQTVAATANEMAAPHAGSEMAYGAGAYAGFSETRHADLLSGLASTPEREQMLLDQLPSVRFIARRIHERLPAHVEMDDLISAGVLGLMDACAKFDNKKNVQFKSYAQFRIRGAILDSLRTLDWSPRELRRKGRAVEEAIRSLSGRLGRAPLEPEIAQEMGLNLGEYQQLLGELKGLEIGSLHIERSEDSGEDELAYLPNNPEEDPLFQCMQGELKQHLIDAIDDLPEKERLVLTLYYYEELTMKEIGLTLGVVESRVSQIHSSAVLRLRVALADLAGPGAKPVKVKAAKAARTR